MQQSALFDQHLRYIAEQLAMKNEQNPSISQYFYQLLKYCNLFPLVK